MGCERFAEDTDQELTDFYSIDKTGKVLILQVVKKKKTTSAKYSSNELQFEEQQEIWKLGHGSTENFAGKLSLCFGMLVMIQNNDATELCITKVSCPIMFRHVPNILAFSAKSRDFTIQE